MKNKRLKLLLIIFPIMIVLAVLINLYFYSKAEDRMLLEEFELDGYTIRTLKFREDDGRLRGLCAVYWKMEKGKRIALKKADIDKILEANGKNWALIENSDGYMRFVDSETQSKATYRKLDYKLGIYSADFVEWRQNKDFRKRDAEIFMMIVE
jgi:hypothetical protein